MKLPLAEAPKPVEVPTLWREAMGIHPDCEEAEPGHTHGCVAFYAILAACIAAYIFAAFKGV